MIYFVRHGECEANVMHLFTGSTNNSPLTEKGKLQAKEVALELLDKKIFVDRIITSPTSRTITTAEVIAQEIGYIDEIIVDRRVTEYDMGSLNGTAYAPITSQLLESAIGNENIELFKNRIWDCICEIKKLNGNTLLVSHGAVFRILEALRQNYPYQKFYDLPRVQNAKIVKLDWLELNPTISV